MKPSLRNTVIAFAVAFTVSLVLAIAGGGVLASAIVGVGLGVLTLLWLRMRAGRGTERRASDAERAAALATPPGGADALVYVYRSGMLGWAVGMDVLLDGRRVAQLRSPRFVRLQVVPGSHELQGGPPAGVARTMNAPARATFTVAAGETVVFALKARTGMTSNTLELVRETDTAAAMRILAGIPMVLPLESAATSL